MIEVNFINKNKEITSNPVYQWDYCRKLHIYGLNITDAVIQVHFCDKSSERPEVRVATAENDYYKVSIPDVLLEISYSTSMREYNTSRVNVGNGETDRRGTLAIYLYANSGAAKTATFSIYANFYSDEQKTTCYFKKNVGTIEITQQSA